MNQPRMVRDFLQHRQQLLGFIFALTRDQVAAEEVFQEVALVILGEAASGKKVDPFLPWAREVARRRTAEFYRKISRRQATSPLKESMIETLCISFQECEEAPERDSLRMAFLRQCMESLSSRARQVIDLRYKVHLGIDQIASELTWQVDSVNVLLSKTRRLLSDCVRSKLSAPEVS